MAGAQLGITLASQALGAVAEPTITRTSPPAASPHARAASSCCRARWSPTSWRTGTASQYRTARGRRSRATCWPSSVICRRPATASRPTSAGSRSPRWTATGSPSWSCGRVATAALTRLRRANGSTWRTTPHGHRDRRYEGLSCQGLLSCPGASAPLAGHRRHRQCGRPAAGSPSGRRPSDRFRSAAPARGCWRRCA